MVLEITRRFELEVLAQDSEEAAELAQGQVEDSFMGDKVEIVDLKEIPDV